MKKITLMLMLLLCLTLTACGEGDFVFDKAVVLNKSSTESFGRYRITTYYVDLEYNGSMYTVKVYEESYTLVSKGSVVSVNYSGMNGIAKLNPVVENKESK